MVHSISADQLMAVIGAIPDPEIPVITIAELGILRDVHVATDGVMEVLITPTYNACPAIHQIEEDIRKLLQAQDIAEHRILITHTPAWTTDWLSDAAREKLRAYGIAPPGIAPPKSIHSTSSQESSISIMTKRHIAATVPCPHCHSDNTTCTSAFGSTACKALYKCLDCLEPFDYFKPY